MNFVSIEFIFFLPPAVLLYWKLPERFRWILLIWTSYLAYTYWNRGAVLLMLGMTLATFGIAGRIAAARGRRRAKAWLSAAVILCVTVFLGLRSAGILPVGISFYTFQMLSYVFEVYQGKMQAEENPAFYALYISFFPQLVAGPIERPGRLLTQLHSPKKFEAVNLVYGGVLILRGFFKKIAIADYLAAFVEKAYQDAAGNNGPVAVFAAVCFAFQIYCDFSGYSDIALGTARLFGIRLMENFRQPYMAVSLRDFWHRWHISLTGWFTDYVYKPLGGNRKGFLRTCFNTFAIFLFSGLWHGMAWTYVVWGAVHGMLMILETVSERLRRRKGRIRGLRFEKRTQGERAENVPSGIRLTVYIRRGITFLLVCYSWIFFRAESMADAVILNQKLFTGWTAGGLKYAEEFLGIGRIDALRMGLMLWCLFLIRDIPKETKDWEQQIVSFTFLSFLLILLIVLSLLLLLSAGGSNAFIYFQF